MPATTTLAQQLTTLAEEDGFGLVIDAGTGATTTITETDTGVSELRGPFTGAKLSVGRPVTVITGGTVGEDSYVSNFSPSSGVVTLSPAITTAATGFIIWEADIEHGKNVEKAVSRALTNRIGRWELRPLTFVPDGDMQGTTIADFWTKSTVGDTLAYVAAQIYPAGSAADEAGAVSLNRLIQLTSTAAGTVDGNGIRVQLSNQLRPWYFRTAIRLVSGTGTLEFKVRDNTNSADIALQVMRGNDANTLTTTTFGDFLICEGTFQLPATCAEIAPRMSVSATTMVAQMAPVIMFPLGAYQFPIPNRMESTDFIGNFYESWPRQGPGGFPTLDVSHVPFTVDGRTHTLFDFGDHYTVTFNVPVHRPLVYEEYVSGAAVSAMADTTTFSADRVHKWAKYELLNWLMNREMQHQKRGDNGTLLPSVYRPRRNAALREAAGSTYEPQMRQVLGRR